MISLLFIDDVFLSENFPLPSNIERKNILTTIKIAQMDVVDLLGKCLYDHLEAQIDAEALTADEEELYELCKMYLVFATAKQLMEFVAVERTLSTSEDTANRMIKSAEDRAGYIKMRIQKFVNKTVTLYDITQADGCTDEDAYNEEGTTTSTGIYYPRNSYTGGNSCDDGIFLENY